MQRLVLAAATALTTCLSAGSALAQEAGTYYGGIVVGSLMSSESRVDTLGNAAYASLGSTIVPSQLKPNIEDVSYGLILGNKFTSKGPIQMGIEIDISSGSEAVSASFSGAAIPPVGAFPSVAPAGLTTTATKEYGLRGSLRGRLGVKVVDGFTVFGTGGLAFAHVENKASVVANGVPSLAWSGTSTQNLTGFTVGLGAEFQIIDGVIIRGEYIYTDLGDGLVTAVGNSVVQSTFGLAGSEYIARTEYKNSEARAGVLLSF